jgi:hypothetical protein
MSRERAERRFPAVEQLRDDLRANLLRAAGANPGARSRLSRRQRVGALAVVAVLALPGGLAVAGVFDSPEVEYECPRAELPPLSEVEAGVPVGSESVLEDLPEAAPENPCSDQRGRSVP